MPRCPACHWRVPDRARCPRDGALPLAAAEAPAALPPTQVPGFRMDPVVGTGGFAHVWQAWRIEDELPVAIKVSHATTAHAHERIAHEAQALARIGPPHVPVLHREGVLGDGRPYAIMELIEEPTLARALAEAPAPLDIGEVGRIGAELLASLEAVHAAGYLHLDLTPENVLVPAGAGCARLVDFGLVRPARGSNAQAATEQTAEVVISGTIEYTPPERLAGRTDLDARTDLYAFGVLLYELLTLRVPLVGDPISIVRGHCTLRPPPPDAFAAVPEALAALCLDCLRKDPAARPPNDWAPRAQQVAARLAAVVRETIG